MPSFEVRTLKQFLNSDQKIDCDCSNYWVCTHTGPLRLDLAMERFGPDFDFYASRELLARHVYCSVCGHRSPTFRLGWKARREHFTGSHGAGIELLPVATSSARQLAREEWPEPTDWLKGGEAVRTFGPRK